MFSPRKPLTCYGLVPHFSFLSSGYYHIFRHFLPHFIAKHQFSRIIISFYAAVSSHRCISFSLFFIVALKCVSLHLLKEALTLTSLCVMFTPSLSPIGFTYLHPPKTQLFSEFLCSLAKHTVLPCLFLCLFASVSFNSGASAVRVADFERFILHRSLIL